MSSSIITTIIIIFIIRDFSRWNKAFENYKIANNLNLFTNSQECVKL